MVLLRPFLNLSHLLSREELVLRLDKLKLLRDVNFGYTDDDCVCIYNFKHRFYSRKEVDWPADDIQQ
jgi:hypothetical protein